MKIRSGFVSNSSSSSFIVCGINVGKNNATEIAEIYEKMGQPMSEEHIECLECGDYWSLPHIEGTEIHVAECGEYSDSLYVGVKCDPTYLGVHDCMNGWIDDDNKKALHKLVEVTGRSLDTYGSIEYC